MSNIKYKDILISGAKPRGNHAEAYKLHEDKKTKELDAHLKELEQKRLRLEGPYIVTPPWVIK